MLLLLSAEEYIYLLPAMCSSEVPATTLGEVGKEKTLGRCKDG